MSSKDGCRATQFAERKIDMTHAAYRAGITAIAADEKDGEDVTARIAQLARAAKMDASTIRHEVTEAQD
jgi:uncharacterized protein YfcZ (UPF0381/DUF406 family)